MPATSGHQKQSTFRKAQTHHQLVSSREEHFGRAHSNAHRPSPTGNPPPTHPPTHRQAQPAGPFRRSRPAYEPNEPYHNFRRRCRRRQATSTGSSSTTRSISRSFHRRKHTTDRSSTPIFSIYVDDSRQRYSRSRTIKLIMLPGGTPITRVVAACFLGWICTRG